jgi:hypothetical protein
MPLRAHSGWNASVNDGSGTDSVKAAAGNDETDISQMGILN